MRTLSSQLVRYFSAITDRRGDGELLAGFLTHNAEADFAELVRRHGPLVWGTCRRALPDHADAEDAFQSVFLVLVQRGHRLISSPCIGPWLHRVAVWNTRNLRRRNARRLAKRETIPEQLLCCPTNPDLSMDLDAALLALPEKHRSSIVLCHLLGFSRADAAAQLGCAERTLSGWLSSGLAQLRVKLRGFDPTRVLGAAGVLVPVGLSNSVVQAALSQRTAVVAASFISSTISQLVEGVIRMFWIKKATAATMGLFAVFALGVGVGLSTRQISPASGGEEKGLVQRLAIDAALIEEMDLDAKIAESSERIKSAKEEVMKALLSYEEYLQSVSEKTDDPRVVKPEDLNQLGKLSAEYEAAKLKLSKLGVERGELLKTKALKAQEKADPTKPKPPIKTTPAATDPLTAPKQLDKQLEDLKVQMMKLQAEAEQAVAESQVARARSEILKQQIQKTAAVIAALEEQKAKSQAQAAPISKGGYLTLNVDAKEKTWPFQVKEFGADGKPLGSTAFENAEVFGRFLARTMKDPNGPKELQISRSTPHSVFDPVEAVCKAVGFKMVVGGIGENKNKNAADPTDRQKEAYDRVDRAKALYEEAIKEGDKLLQKQKLEQREKELMEQLNRLMELNKEQERKLRELQELKKQEEKKAPQKVGDPTKPEKQ